jgi:3-methyladenine DNA glycosylase AlkD
MGEAVSADVQSALDWLKRHASRATRDGLARYAIPADRAFGVSMRDVQTLAKQIGRRHDLAIGLWETGWHEARLLAAYVDEPARVTRAQMDHWAREFDNWAVCDTVCFALFDRTPHAWSRVEAWAGRKPEFVKRGAFALLWALALHDTVAPDAPFRRGLALVEREASDDRHYVSKAIDMAIGAIGRRNAALHAAAVETAGRLAGAPARSAQSVGTRALRTLAARRPRR